MLPIHCLRCGVMRPAPTSARVGPSLRRWRATPPGLGRTNRHRGLGPRGTLVLHSPGRTAGHAVPTGRHAGPNPGTRIHVRVRDDNFLTYGCGQATKSAATRTRVRKPNSRPASNGSSRPIEKFSAPPIGFEVVEILRSDAWLRHQVEWGVPMADAAEVSASEEIASKGEGI